MDAPTVGIYINSSYESEVGKCILVANTEDVILKYENQSYVVSQIILCTFYVFLAFLTACLNGVAIFTINNCDSLKRNLCYYLVMLQSCCDLVTGLISIPLYGFFNVSETAQVLSCQFRYYATSLAPAPSGVSFAMMVALSFERYTSIVHPIIHRNRLSQKIFLKYLLVNIVIYVTTTASSPFWSSIFYIGYTFHRFLLLATVGYFYVTIYQTTKGRLRLKKQQVNYSLNLSAKNKISREFLIQRKLTKTCFLTCVAYVSCYLPLVCIIIATIEFEKKSLPLLRQYQSWGVAISSMNPCLNSIIFFWTRPALRREIKKVMSRMLSKNFY